MFLLCKSWESYTWLYKRRNACVFLNKQFTFGEMLINSTTRLPFYDIILILEECVLRLIECIETEVFYQVSAF